MSEFHGRIRKLWFASESEYQKACAYLRAQGFQFAGHRRDFAPTTGFWRYGISIVLDDVQFDTFNKWLIRFHIGCRHD